MECCVTRNWGAFSFMYVRLNVCVSVKMGAVIVRYGVTMCMVVYHSQTTYLFLWFYIGDAYL